MNLTPELLADVRKKAEEQERHFSAVTICEFQEAASPAVVLALLDRIEVLEQRERMVAKVARESPDEAALAWLRRLAKP